jgi:hypothetical protein
MGFFPLWAVSLAVALVGYYHRVACRTTGLRGFTRLSAHRAWRSTAPGSESRPLTRAEPDTLLDRLFRPARLVVLRVCPGDGFHGVGQCAKAFGYVRACWGCLRIDEPSQYQAVDEGAAHRGDPRGGLVVGAVSLLGPMRPTGHVVSVGVGELRTQVAGVASAWVATGTTSSIYRRAGWAW